MRVLAVAAVLMAAASPAAAEINVADSVEWMTADADLVVRGTIARVRTRKGPGQVVWYLATVAVTETLAGNAPTRVTFAMRHLHGPTPDDWRRGNTELLLYLVDSKRRVAEDPDYASARFALRVDRGSSSSAIPLTGKAVGPLFAMDFSVARSRGVILWAARRAARFKSAAKSAIVDVPLSTPAFRALYAGSAVWLVAPVDARLEALARRWVQHREAHRRAEGVEVLSHFPSAANTAILRGLLSDAAPVRAAARRVLARWKK